MSYPSFLPTPSYQFLAMITSVMTWSGDDLCSFCQWLLSLATAPSLRSFRPANCVQSRWPHWMNIVEFFWYKDALQMYKKIHLKNMSEECSVKEDSVSSQMSDLVRNFNCVQWGIRPSHKPIPLPRWSYNSDMRCIATGVNICSLRSSSEITTF